MFLEESLQKKKKKKEFTIRQILYCLKFRYYFIIKVKVKEKMKNIGRPVSRFIPGPPPSSSKVSTLPVLSLPTTDEDTSILFYVYKEDPEDAENLRFFLEKGGYHDDPRHMYVLIINDHLCSVPLPTTTTNFLVFRKKNSFDLSSWKEVVQLLGIDFVLQWKLIFFMNSSCRGPFLPVGIDRHQWRELFQRLFVSDSSVRIVGPVIEIPSHPIPWPESSEVDKKLTVPFLHTYMFCVDRQGMRTLLDKIFPLLTPESSKEDMIKIERWVTGVFLLSTSSPTDTVKSLLLRHANTDWRNRSQWIPLVTGFTCPEVPGNYSGMDLHPLEVIFFKNIRRQHQFRSAHQAGLSPSTQRVLRQYSSWM